jgi:hypothetical protein
VNKIDSKSVGFGTESMISPDPLEDDDILKARKVVAGFAKDADEFVLFLDMMGILPESIKPEPATTPKRKKKHKEYKNLSPAQKARRNKRSVLRTNRKRLMDRAKERGGFTPDEYAKLHDLDDQLGYPRTENVRVYTQFEIDEMAEKEAKKKKEREKKRRRMSRIRHALSHGGIAWDGSRVQITPEILRELYEWEQDPLIKRYYNSRAS